MLSFYKKQDKYIVLSNLQIIYMILNKSAKNRNKKYLENLGQEENYCLTVDCYPSVDDEIFDLIKEIYKPIAKEW